MSKIFLQLAAWFASFLPAPKYESAPLSGITPKPRQQSADITRSLTPPVPARVSLDSPPTVAPDKAKTVWQQAKPAPQKLSQYDALKLAGAETALRKTKEQLRTLACDLAQKERAADDQLQQARAETARIAADLKSSERTRFHLIAKIDKLETSVAEKTLENEALDECLREMTVTHKSQLRAARGMPEQASPEAIYGHGEGFLQASQELRPSTYQGNFGDPVRQNPSRLRILRPRPPGTSRGRVA